MGRSSDIVQISNDTKNHTRTRQLPKRASASKILKQKHISSSKESDLIESKRDQIVNEEAEAIALTDGVDHPRPNRRITDFVLYDVNGKPQPVEMLEATDIFISGRILPLEESADKHKERGIKCLTIGRVESWAISGYEDGSPVVWLSTKIADYDCVKPTHRYKKLYGLLYEKARACIEIYKKLSGFDGGDPNMSYGELLAQVIHSIKRTKNFSQGLSVRKFIISHGEFIHKQITGLDESSKENDQLFCGLPALTSLRDESKNNACLVKSILAPCESALKIDEEGKEQLTGSTRQKKRKRTTASLMAVLKRKKRKMNHIAVLKTMAMPATVTGLIYRKWKIFYDNYLPGDSLKKIDLVDVKKDEVDVTQPDEEDDDTQETIILTVGDGENSDQLTSHFSNREIIWVGEAVKMNGDLIYKKATVRASEVSIGCSVLVETTKSKEPSFCLIEYLFEDSDERKMAHGRLMVKGFQTVLGNTANEREVFLTNNCLIFNLKDIVQNVVVEIPSMPWGYQHRKENSFCDKIDRDRAKDRKDKEFPWQYFCKLMYCPDKGGFFSFQKDTIGLGTGICHSCEKNRIINQNEVFKKNSTCFTYMGDEYNLNDFVYLAPYYFGADKKVCKTFKGGKNVGLKAYVIGQLLEIEVIKATSKLNSKSKVKFRRFFRPEDISAEKAYRSDIREVYYSEEIVNMPIKAIEGKCKVMRKQDVSHVQSLGVFDHIFYCDYLYDHKSGAINQLPAHIKQSYSKATDKAENRNNGKCKERKYNFNATEERMEEHNPLSTLDIFAGCGGLSEGLRQSGVCETKWAIEYEEPAGEAFRYNHPETVVHINNCNVILRAIMDACGDSEDCISTSEATELAKKLDKELVDKLPFPGQVDFINGGPPCQGFSGMNRFHQSPWSRAQCEMILAYLSYADYFRPKYFLLENVRNFVSFNKGHTFRLTLASLIEMGYQVRFGILEAGAYGISQSRKRAFIWAASPGEKLPDWPEPIHVFATSKLNVNLNNGARYVAVRSTSLGAPLRPITVRDTIGDLPVVNNGASLTTMEYEDNPVSWFQKIIRGNMSILTDHISKQMSELNLTRCKKIPIRPGADWRDLPNEKVHLGKGKPWNLIPQFMLNSTKRNNHWKGLLGRMDWEGNFLTTITDPQPTGKVGMCFHPNQDRIVTVRECARSQGFLDSYKFVGNIQDKHRQVGNAVPPPLAFALGKKLKEAVEGNKSCI